MIIHCRGCGTERAVYSMYERGGNKNKGSPTLDDYNRLQRWMEIGSICGKALVVSFYHTKEEHHCNDMIKSHYYKHKGTKDICVVCYGSEGMMSKK